MALCLDCANLPTQFGGNQFPTGTFFSNFDNPCYYVPLAYGVGTFAYGDLNSVYDVIYFKVNPAYQLILVGTFPQARYFSITAYDEHSAIGRSITDQNIVPLTSAYVNPFQPGVAYQPGQQFAVPINFGGTAGQEQHGCMMTGYNTDVNALDATQRHLGMDWNSDTAFFQQYPSAMRHVVDTPDHTNPNTAGVLFIRNYLNNAVQRRNESSHHRA